MKNITIAELKSAIATDENHVLLDVRTPQEEIEGTIPNSIRINIMDNDFPSKISDLDSTKNYYVYCRSGNRSVTACQFMDRQGLTTYNVLGGIQEWNKNL